MGWLSLGLVAGATGVAAIRATGYDVPDEVSSKLKVLSPWQYVALRAIGDRIIAPGEANVGEFADAYLEDMAASDRSDLLKLVAVIEHAAPLALGHIHRFTALSADEQDAVLASLNTSSIALVRAGFEALKAVAFMAYYRQPSSWPALGYPGPIAPRSVK